MKQSIRLVLALVLCLVLSLSSVLVGVPTARAAEAASSCVLTTISSPASGGTVARSPDAASYTPGTVVTLTATASPGYVFVSWSGSITETANPAAVTMDADKAIIATFAQPDAFEPDGDQAHASIIATDGSLQHHNFAANGDEDWVRFTAVPGAAYTIDTLNLESNCDTVLEFYGPPGIIDYNDDDSGLASRIDFECPAGKGGTYYVRVWQISGSYGANTGYDLRVQPALQVAFSNADNAGKDYGFTNVLNHVTVTVTRGGTPVAGASVDVDSGTSTLTTNASGQAAFTFQGSWDTYSYLQVTSGNSKVTEAYFWVIAPDSGLIVVKPQDVNGYYLTRFTLSTFHPVGATWWTWNSGASNTTVLPFSDVAVVTAPSDQHGGGGYVFTLHPTLTAGQKTVLTPYAFTDCVALSLSATLNGTALTNAFVYLRNQAYASTTSSYAALTDSSGSSITYVTPGTWTAAVIQYNYSTPSVWLTKKNILASSSVASSIIVTTSQLGTLTCIALDGSSNPASYNDLYLQSEGISTSLETTLSNSTYLFSPGTYEDQYDYVYLYPSGTSEQWGYGFDCSATHTVTAGSIASFTFGGPLTMTVNTPASVTPGQDVTTKLTVADPQGHRLYWMYGYTNASSPTSLPDEPMKGADPRTLQGEHPSEAPLAWEESARGPWTKGLGGERPAFTGGDAMGLRPPAEADAWGWVYPNPHLLIKDPAATVKVDRQDVDLNSAYWSGYSWTVPADATSGTWHAAFTFDTGAYQGAISTDRTFVVSASSTTISGDVDGNRSVTMGDALLLAQSIVGIATLTTAQRLAADVNGDGSITMADTLLVAQIVVGIVH